MEATKELVNALATGDADGIEVAFNSAMAEKISARLDDMRADMAKSMFRAPEETPAVTEEPVTTEE